MERLHFNHGILLKSKAKSDSNLKPVYEAYLSFLRNISSFNITDTRSVVRFVREFNSYRTKVLYQIEDRQNSGQENLRSSMLEEFFCHLFSDLIKRTLETEPTNLFLGKTNAYVDLTFAPSSFAEMFIKPNPYIHTKDQDFILGVKIELIINANKKNEVSNEVVIPVVAIECKTYIERNMLDSCSGTASRLKKAMPYCIYVVAAEYMKLKDEQPELSDINEVYILCKSTVSERNALKSNRKPPHLIHEDLILDLYKKIEGHLKSIWWSPDKALISGKIINRPN